MKKQTKILHTDHDRREFVGFLEALTLDKPVKVTAEDYRRNRTLNQNALLWEWYSIAGAETGYTSNELHEMCKALFCPPKFVSAGNRTVEIRSTAQMDTKEMTDFMDAVYRFFAGEVGVVLPLPEPV